MNNPKYFSLTKLEKEIDLQENPENFNEVRQRQEILKCANDFAYFCHRYVKIGHPKLGEIPMNLYNHQRRSVTHALSHRFTGILKPRQMGLSALFQAFALWRGLFRYDERIMIVHSGDRVAIYHSYVLDRMTDRLPSWMKPEIAKRNYHESHFADSNVQIWNISWTASCGRSIDWLILDEASIHKDMDREWSAVSPTLSEGGHCIAFSSMYPASNGKSWWDRVVSGDLPFSLLELRFRDHPDYDNPEWVSKILSQLGYLNFCSEILCHPTLSRKDEGRVSTDPVRNRV